MLQQPRNVHGLNHTAEIFPPKRLKTQILKQLKTEKYTSAQASYSVNDKSSDQTLSSVPGFKEKCLDSLKDSEKFKLHQFLKE